MLKTHHSFVALSLALTALSGAAPAAENDIKVTASGPVSEDQALAHLDSVIDPVKNQIARYVDDVCPSVSGVNDQFAAQLTGRLRAVIAASGAPLGKEGCAPNLIVMFSGNPAKLFADIERDRTAWTKGLNPAERSELRRSKDPILAWGVTSVRNADGQRPEEARAGYEAPGLRVRSASIVDHSSQQTIDASFVLVSLEAVNNRPLWQIADHIAMRALTPTRVPEKEAVPTVLTAFEREPTEAPSMMTSGDLALLRGIYDHDGLADRATERRRLAREMARS